MAKENKSPRSQLHPSKHYTFWYHSKRTSIPFKCILPMVDPNDLVIGGWDINSANLAAGMRRAEVFDVDLQNKLAPYMEKIVPWPSVYDPDFIAANQQDRADNLIKGNKQQCMEKLRQDIRNFKKNNQLDKVIVIWSANTERFADVIHGINDTADNLLASIKKKSFRSISFNALCGRFYSRRVNLHQRKPTKYLRTGCHRTRPTSQSLHRR